MGQLCKIQWEFYREERGMNFIRRIGLCVSLAGRLLRVFTQMIYGAWRVSHSPAPYVSIFGSARFKLDDPYAKQAHELAKMFVEANISVLTGGGPGIMEAASCGAIPIKGAGRSIGIGVADLHERKNPCVHEYFELDYFFARKWLLARYSVAFVVFPGGFGTLDELVEVLTLMQTKELARAPIVLIGKEFWQPFMTWIAESMHHGAISEEDVKLFSMTDDLYEAFCTVSDRCRLVKQASLKK
jgi:uncharacterized protein (TIGR00730 family)